MILLTSIDGQILLWIQEHIRCDILTPIIRFITHLGDAGMIWIVLTVVLLLVPKTRRVGCMTAVALLLTLLVDNVLLKNLVARIRPYDQIPELHILIERQVDFSFPSGHSAASFSVAMAIYLSGHKKVGTAALIFASLIAVSRLYLGVHYPTDVIGGVLIGSLSAVVIRKIMTELQNKKSGNKSDNI